MMGGAIRKPSSETTLYVHHTEEVVITKDSGVVPQPEDHLTGIKMTPTASEEHPIRLINLTTGKRLQLEEGSINGSNKILLEDETTLFSNKGDHIRIFWTEAVTGDNEDAAVEVTISPSTFPGTYKVVGDTFMRSEKTGKDEAFQFIIGKAKVASNVTITLEAEGDPSTFEMTLTVLRDKNEKGEEEMMKLVRYTVDEEDSTETGDDVGSVAEVTSSTSTP